MNKCVICCVCQHLQVDDVGSERLMEPREMFFCDILMNKPSQIQLDHAESVHGSGNVEEYGGSTGPETSTALSHVQIWTQKLPDLILSDGHASLPQITLDLTRMILQPELPKKSWS